MKEFDLRVTWEMCGTVKAKANTLEEAMEIFHKTSDGIMLPEGWYVDFSFKLSADEVTEMEAMLDFFEFPNNEEEV